MSEHIEVWAEEPDTRVRAEPWKGGAILTITSPWALQPIVVTVAAYRWEHIVAALADVNSTLMPSIGDRVEFQSDRQTEKGPSSGSVIAVDRNRQTVTIRHSDHPGETFRWQDVKVKYCRLRGPGDTFWALL